MAPIRSATTRIAMTGNSLAFPKAMATRSKRTTENVVPVGKRKAVNSPPKDKAVKRSAFGDLTNAAGKSVVETKKVFKSLTSQAVKTTTKVERKPVSKVAPFVKTSTLTQVKTLKERNVATVAAKRVSKPIEVSTVANTSVKKAESVATAPTRRSGRITRRSLMSSADENSLYVSALDESGDSVTITAEIAAADSKEKSEAVGAVAVVAGPAKSKGPVRQVPPAGVEDFDLLHWEDPNQIGNYAQDIFDYLKSREKDFVVRDYMEDQIHLTRWMRSLLVDWMVEVQENFELNHETLYLAVKVVDLYLSKTVVKKDNLQLVGAAAVFIASKFDERIPPLVDDLIYICDGAYTQEQLLKMEVSILKTIDYELGVPLSYRFQRRYARCAHIGMPQLTLARYILELSLMEYSMVTLSDSKMGAAALYLALRMQNISSWTPTLEYFSGYKLSDFLSIAMEMNDVLHRKPKSSLMTIRNKYAHKVFFEVANLPLIDNAQLTQKNV